MGQHDESKVLEVLLLVDNGMKREADSTDMACVI